MYMAVSETAKSHGKSGSASHAGRKAALLAAAALMASGMFGMAEAADKDIVKGDGVEIKYDISPTNDGTNIAVGKNAKVFIGGGTQESMLSFGEKADPTMWHGLVQTGWNIHSNEHAKKNLPEAIAIGTNSYARTGSIEIGAHTLAENQIAIGDTTADKLRQFGVASTTLGTNSYTGGGFATTIGSYNVQTNQYEAAGLSDAGNATKNAFATVIGTFNSNESMTGSSSSGVANMISGTANKVTNSNGAIVMGAGNSVKDSIASFDTSAYSSLFKSAADMQKALMEGVAKSAGGATLVIGGGNSAEKTQNSQIMGVGNSMKSTTYKKVQYNYLDGFNSSITDASHVKVLGQSVTINKGADSNTVIGDYRTVAEGQTHNVIIGNADEKTPITTEKKDTVIVGHNANATIDGGVAIGSGSIANVDKGQKGYYVKHDQRSEEGQGYPFQKNDSAWISRAGAVSVGDTTNKDQSKWITRQITGVAAGTEDTDAVNVAQLKTAASEVKGGTNIASVTTENAADGHTIYTVNAKGAEVKGDSNFTVTPSTDEKTNITTYGLALNDTITIGKGKDAKPITIDGTKGEITGLTNRDTKAADFAKAGRAATEEQLDAMHNAITGEDRYVQSGTIDTTSGTMKLTVANGKTVDITGLTDYQLDTDGTKTKYDASAHKLTLSMKDTLNTGNPAKSVEFDGIANTADVAKAKTEIKGGTNIASLGTETAADGHTIYTVNAKGTEVTGDDNFTVTPSTDEKTNITTYGLALNDTITIGKGKDANPITIDGTKGEISGLTNITWHKDVDYSKSTKAATEAQIQSAVNAAKEDVKASDVDTHVAKGSYAVDTITTADGQKTQGVSLDIVDKDGKPTGNKVEITDVAKASDIGDISKLSDGVKNADGKKTTVVDAINNVNTKVDKVDKKVGDLDYSSTNYVAKNDSATTAIGKLDAAIKDASSVANNITGGSNIDVTETNDKNGKVTGHQVALKNDISLNSVTAKTVKADEVNTGKLTVSDSAAIGNVSINKDGKGTVNGLTNTTWNADKITSGQAATEDQLKAATKNAVNYDGDDSKTVTLRQDTTIKNVADTSIEKGSRNAVNAGTVYNETRVANDGHYIKAANTAGANITALDNQVAANAGNIFNLDNRVGELGSRINKVGAGAAALAALHPLDFDPSDKWDFAAGVGNYRNATAAAVGLFYRPNERTMFNLGWTMGDNRNMVNGGFSLKFGKSNKYIKYSKTEMAAVIDNQSREIAELKAKDAQNAKDNAEMKAEIEALKKQVEALAARK